LKIGWGYTKPEDFVLFEPTLTVRGLEQLPKIRNVFARLAECSFVARCFFCNPMLAIV
jgi:hypothetical protein